MIQTVHAIHRQQLNDLGNGEFTVRYPADADTVLSIQPDGSVQTRPHGTTGAYERCRRNGTSLAFRPLGVKGATYIVPIVDDAPNG